MTKSIVLGLLTAGIMVGCGGTTDEEASPQAKKIIGTWVVECFQYNGKYTEKEFSFMADGKMTKKKATYSDADCLQDETVIYNDEREYTVGDDTVDSNDETAYELCWKHVGNESCGWYTMFRFKDENTLFVARDDAAHDGTSSENRANYINPNWAGYKKQ